MQLIDGFEQIDDDDDDDDDDEQVITDECVIDVLKKFNPDETGVG